MVNLQPRLDRKLVQSVQLKSKKTPLVVHAERPSPQLMRVFLSEEGSVYHFSKVEFVATTCQNLTVRGIQELRVKHVCIYNARGSVLFGLICFHFTSPHQSLICPFWKHPFLISSTVGPALCLISGSRLTSTSEGVPMNKLLKT